jgi:hypothetical protein
MRWVPLAFAAFLAVTFWGIAEWNRRAADKLQRQIEEIAQWQDNSDPHAAR